MTLSQSQIHHDSFPLPLSGLKMDLYLPLLRPQQGKCKQYACLGVPCL